MIDSINHPSHYTHGGIEVIAAIEAWGLNYHLGNMVKYIARADRKGKRLEDLRKAHWYLIRENESKRRQFYRQAASANASISADAACKAWGLPPRLYAVICEAVLHGNLGRAIAALEDEIAECQNEESCNVRDEESLHTFDHKMAGLDLLSIIDEIGGFLSPEHQEKLRAAREALK